MSPDPRTRGKPSNEQGAYTHSGPIEGDSRIIEKRTVTIHPRTEPLYQSSPDPELDYMEEGSEEVLAHEHSVATHQVSQDVLQALIDRPLPVATAIMAMTSQLVIQNKLLTDIAQKLEHAKSSTWLQESLKTTLVQIKHFCGDMRADLKYNAHVRGEQGRCIAGLNQSIQSLSQAVRAQQVSSAAINASVAANLAAKGAAVTPTPHILYGCHPT